MHAKGAGAHGHLTVTPRTFSRHTKRRRFFARVGRSESDVRPVFSTVRRVSAARPTPEPWTFAAVAFFEIPQNTGGGATLGNWFGHNTPVIFFLDPPPALSPPTSHPITRRSAVRGHPGTARASLQAFIPTGRWCRNTSRARFRRTRTVCTALRLPPYLRKLADCRSCWKCLLFLMGQQVICSAVDRRIILAPAAEETERCGPMPCCDQTGPYWGGGKCGPAPTCGPLIGEGMVCEVAVVTSRRPRPPSRSFFSPASRSMVCEWGEEFRPAGGPKCALPSVKRGNLGRVNVFEWRGIRTKTTAKKKKSVDALGPGTNSAQSHRRLPCQNPVTPRTLPLRVFSDTASGRHGYPAEAASPSFRPGPSGWMRSSPRPSIVPRVQVGHERM